MPKLRCRFLYLDLGNTEVVSWDLGKKMPISGYKNLHMDIGNSLTIIFYHDFSRNGFGVLHLRFRPKKKADLLARGTPNPSFPQIRRIAIFYFNFSKYTKKNICKL